jgi:hypothetical protein
MLPFWLVLVMIDNVRFRAPLQPEPHALGAKLLRISGKYFRAQLTEILAAKLNNIVGFSVFRSISIRGGAGMDSVSRASCQGKRKPQQAGVKSQHGTKLLRRLMATAIPSGTAYR